MPKRVCSPGRKFNHASSCSRDEDRDIDDDSDTPCACLGATRLVLIGRPDEPVFTALMFAAMFAQAQDRADAKEENADGVGVEHAEMQDNAGDEEDWRKNARRRAKEKWCREKENREGGGRKRRAG